MNDFQPLHQPESSMPYAPNQQQQTPMQYTSMPQSHPGFGYGTTNGMMMPPPGIMAMPPQMYPMQYGGNGGIKWQ